MKMLCMLNPEYLFTEVLKYELRTHHKAILTNILNNRISLNLCARGHGKSTIGNIAFCIYKIVQNRNIRILVISNTQTQAQAFIREIKNQLESNTKLIELFGVFQDDRKWTESELTVKGRTSVKKESTLTALGATGQLTGKHADLIICDDITDFESARTDVQRKKLSEWFRTAAIPALEPTGQLVVLGTRYHPLDIYEEMINSGQYAVQIQKAIKDDGTSLWPEHFSIETLNKTKEELGSLIFSLQYSNDISIARQGSIFKYEWFNFYETTPTDLKIYAGCDLAISMKETSDYFVMCTIGFDKTSGKFYVLDLFRDRLSFKSQMDIIKKKAQQWQPISISIESNAFQAALSGELIRSTSLPIKQITTVKDKVSRAQRRSALFENGKILLRKDMNILIEELCLFPNGSHDDAFDALDLALTAFDGMSHHVPIFPSFGPMYGASGISISGSSKKRPFSIMHQP